MMNDENIRPLREALDATPDNLPLRLHLAETLSRGGRHAEAEAEYREALRQQPGRDNVKTALANCFFEQDKNSESLVIIEDLVASPNTPAEAYLLHARLLVRRGDLDHAAGQYRRAIDLDAELADEALADRLGVNAGQAWQDPDDPRLTQTHQPLHEEPVIEQERPDIGFDSVGGMEAVKEEIRMKIIHPLQHPEIYEVYGKKIGGGILMYGPPGCGKTHLARATAGQVKASFISVGIHDVLDMFIGNSEKQLHQIFEQARRHTPCVLFFDEVDALGASRTDMRQTGGRTAINQFLAELDGLQSNNEGILVLGATNTPWHLDAAFRRPGRFDRVLFVPPPDDDARAAILRIILEGKPTDKVDLEHVAKKARDFSGADLKALVDVTIEAKLAEAMKRGIPQPITNKDLLRAAKTVKPTTSEWFATARNYALYSNQGGAYDDILDYLKLK